MRWVSSLSYTMYTIMAQYKVAYIRIASLQEAETVHMVILAISLPV